MFQISKELLIWFQFHGRKFFPWQNNSSIYRIWISEIMLQQTQVNTVIPYYNRFIQKFPVLESLRNVSLDEILFFWSGLGYYNRARNLYETVKIIFEKYDGVFPSEYKEIISLPGIGRSTAGAILSFSKNQSFPVLDGNIKRVLKRCFGLGVRVIYEKSILEKKLWNFVIKLIPNNYSRYFNQALIDLGATVCKKNCPTCEFCPFIRYCRSYLDFFQISLNLKSKIKINKIKKTKVFLVINYKQYFWLEKRFNTNFWKGLFVFPEFCCYEEMVTWLKLIKFSFNKKKIKNSINMNYKFDFFDLKAKLIHINVNKKIFLFLKKKTKKGFWFDCNFQKKKVGFPVLVRDFFKKINLNFI